MSPISTLYLPHFIQLNQRCESTRKKVSSLSYIDEVTINLPKKSIILFHH
jgi:hypothetical protein